MDDDTQSRQGSASVRKAAYLRTAAFLGLVFLIGCLAIGCSTGGAPIYTSQDIAPLPCESPDLLDRRFFYPLEFDQDANMRFETEIPAAEAFAVGQRAVLRKRIQEGGLKDVFVVMHGWNKVPSIAELDYQNFVCRLYRLLIAERNLNTRELIIVGIFWPSTYFTNLKDPLLLKPYTFGVIRARADVMARKAVREVLMLLAQGPAFNLHLIGHSFGGRVLAIGVACLAYEPDPDLWEMLVRTDAILLNAAISADDLAESAPWKGCDDDQRHPKPGGVLAHLRERGMGPIFNVYSTRDLANGVLFRFAALLNSDETSKGAGAYPVPGFPEIPVLSSGRVNGNTSGPRDTQLKNVNATEIVFDHSDIYKGRVSILITELLKISDESRPRWSKVTAK